MTKSFTDLDNVFGSAIHCGIKQEGLDLAYIHVPTAVASAGVFTQHKFKASSVSYTKKCLKNHTLKAMIINSGNANAVTGKEGEANTRAMAKKVAGYLNLAPKEVGVASTGIIGVQLPMAKIDAGLTSLFQKKEQTNGTLVAEGILTTDLVPKQVWVEQKIGKKNIVISGITKGSGMIAPNMATTLGFLVTNVNIDSLSLNTCLTQAIDDSYNMMSVDTDTSTNDMVVCFATGQHKIAKHDPEQLAEFQTLLTKACQLLAIEIAKDGEGATKLITATVSQAVSKKDAQTIAKLVIDSPLVKTAIHGEDPNWGRLLMAIGKNPDVKMNPDKVTVYIGEYMLVKAGIPVAVDRDKVKQELAKKDVSIHVQCGLGNGSATAWGCDLTKGYIDINTEYN